MLGTQAAKYSIMFGSDLRHSKSIAITLRRPTRLLRLIAWLLLCTTLSGLAACASAPVQAMSDARQAIRAAQDAGAAQVAPMALDEAQNWLNRAEANLNRHYFRAARHDAERAHGKAVEALEAARFPSAKK